MRKSFSSGRTSMRMRMRISNISEEILRVFNKMKMLEWRWDKLGDEEFESDVKRLSNGKNKGIDEVFSFFIKHSFFFDDIKEDG